MTVVRAKHVVDIKLESQAVLQKALVYRQVGVEHRLVDVMVFLISLCDVSRHNGEHRPFRIESVVEFIKSQRQPEYVDEVTAGELEMKNKEAGALFDRTSMGMSAGNSNDDLYEQAVQIVRNDKKASTSYIQRRLGIGYNKAATIIERMEAEGVVTAADHVGRREVI